MTPFFLMLAVCVLLHLPGLRSWAGAREPADKAAVAMGLVLLLAGALHFVVAEPLVQMIEPFLPSPKLLVLVSGAAEVLIAIGLLVPRTRKPAGWAAVALFVAVWPANIHAAVTGSLPEAFGEASPLYLGARVPFQLLYVGWAAWVGLGHLPGLEFRRRVMARTYDRIQAPFEEWVAPRRRALLAGVDGTVLELGPGTGVNFAYYPTSIRWIGVEPNPHMHAQLMRRAEEHGIQAECRTIGAEGMDVRDASVDVVVSTLVLCSVPDPDHVLQDIRRALRPGGRFVFLEHVAAPRRTWLRCAQTLLSPVWCFFPDRCRPDRALGDAVRDAGFGALDIDAFRAPRSAAPPWVSPFVSGTAVRSDGGSDGTPASRGAP